MDQLLESMTGVVVTDMEGNIVYVNQRYADLLEVDPREVIGKPVKEIIPNTRMDIVTRTGKEEIGSVFVIKNGETIIVNRLPITKDGKIIGAFAFSVLSKIDELNTLSTIEQVNRLKSEISQYKHELGRLRGAKYSLEQIVGDSPVLQNIKEIIKKVSQTRSTVLISGETGTGKELIAHAIHQESPRNHKPLVRLNCAAIPGELLESELFGYEEGAFTGAKKGGKPGKFELAHGGTLLLDEINQLPLYLQSKLLRAIQEKEIERVGGVKPIDVDLRLICITNQNLIELVKKGEFREDLYYRINVVLINVPPLRDRAEDIPQLVDRCIVKINKDIGLNIQGVDSRVLDLFSKYDWPGNVRELEHVLERAANMVLAGNLDLESFEFFLPRMFKGGSTTNAEARTCLEEVRFKAERDAIMQALVSTGGNKKRASELLKIDRSVLYDKIKKYGINV
ncbi:MAG: sigma-54 interaction domain-containing protein [Bacillota bacterium]